MHLGLDYDGFFVQVKVCQVPLPEGRYGVFVQGSLIDEVVVIGTDGREVGAESAGGYSFFPGLSYGVDHVLPEIVKEIQSWGVSALKGSPTKSRYMLTLDL